MKKLFVAFLFLMTVQAQAESTFGLAGGFRSTNFDTDVSGASVTGQNGFQLGGLAWLHIVPETFFLRLGFLYSQRYAQITSGAVKTDIKLTYLDIPVTAQYQFGEFGGVFAGPILAMNQSKECTTTGSTSGSCQNVASSITPIAIGVSFKFAPEMGAELAYEFTGSKIADGLTGMKSIGANFVYYFE